MFGKEIDRVVFGYFPRIQEHQQLQLVFQRESEPHKRHWPVCLVPASGVQPIFQCFEFRYLLLSKDVLRAEKHSGPADGWIFKFQP